MPEALWTSTGELGHLLRASEGAATIREGCNLGRGGDLARRLAELTAQYSPLKVWNLLLGVRLAYLKEAQEVLESDSDQAWLASAAQAGWDFQVLVEHLRAQLPGYPVLRVPHIKKGSPYLFHPFFFEGFPWQRELLQSGRHLETIEVRDLFKDAAALEKVGAVARALREEPRIERLGELRSALSAVDKRALDNASRGFIEQVKEEVIDERAGQLAMSRFHYARAALAKAVNTLDGRALDYAEAFEEANELINIVAAALNTLATVDPLYAIEPYRFELGPGDEIRPGVVATEAGDPFLSLGGVVFTRGPVEELDGFIFADSVTHRLGRSQSMTLTGKYVITPLGGART